jgi:Cys-tRNA synthase (O-phospho-L-seryl-tRNA:Cys-tRNA synthase)
MVDGFSIGDLCVQSIVLVVDCVGVQDFVHVLDRMVAITDLAQIADCARHIVLGLMVMPVMGCTGQLYASGSSVRTTNSGLEFMYACIV